ncbi:MAG: hypothetical protein PHG85_07510, partial [Candidatus Altiarchaeota archaeon]|nr:hypothetical protein [Candidatus Altiarchaeota archaeon]
MNIHLSKGSLKSPLMERIIPLTVKRKAPCFMVSRPFMPLALGYHSSAYAMPAPHQDVNASFRSSFVRGGC